MKIINLIKSIPFLSTLLIILLLSIPNQKQDTKLRILIWSTPSFSLGTYLSISTATGFLLSYILTTNLYNINQKSIKKRIKYKAENKSDESNQIDNSDYDISYNNTLIERDIKDPSPTINASFRVIGKTNRKEDSLINDESQIYSASDFEDESDDFYYKEKINLQYNNKSNLGLNDWNDDTYANW